jgi:hypothetical protein
MAADKAMLERYIATGNCPFCGAPNPQGDQLEFEGQGRLTQQVTCLECEETWQDVYQLTDIDEGGEASTQSAVEMPPVANPSGKHYYRQVFTVEVLSDEPVDFNSLEDMHHAITSGDCSGDFRLSRQEEVTATEMIELLEAQGSDASFLVAEEDLPEQAET